MGPEAGASQKGNVAGALMGSDAAGWAVWGLWLV